MAEERTKKEAVKYLSEKLMTKGEQSARELAGTLSQTKKEIRDAAGKNPEGVLQFVKSYPKVFRVSKQGFINVRLTQSTSECKELEAVICLQDLITKIDKMHINQLAQKLKTLPLTVRQEIGNNVEDLKAFIIQQPHFFHLAEDMHVSSTTKAFRDTLKEYSCKDKYSMVLIVIEIFIKCSSKIKVIMDAILAGILENLVSQSNITTNKLTQILSEYPFFEISKGQVNLNLKKLTIRKLFEIYVCAIVANNGTISIKELLSKVNAFQIAKRVGAATLKGLASFLDSESFTKVSDFVGLSNDTEVRTISYLFQTVGTEGKMPLEGLVKQVPHAPSRVRRYLGTSMSEIREFLQRNDQIFHLTLDRYVQICSSVERDGGDLPVEQPCVGNVSGIGVDSCDAVHQGKVGKIYPDHGLITVSAGKHSGQEVYFNKSDCISVQKGENLSAKVQTGCSVSFQLRNGSAMCNYQLTAYNVKLEPAAIKEHDQGKVPKTSVEKTKVLKIVKEAAVLLLLYEELDFSVLLSILSEILPECMKKLASKESLSAVLSVYDVFQIGKVGVCLKGKPGEGYVSKVESDYGVIDKTKEGDKVFFHQSAVYNPPQAHVTNELDYQVKVKSSVRYIASPEFNVPKSFPKKRALLVWINKGANLIKLSAQIGASKAPKPASLATNKKEAKPKLEKVVKKQSSTSEAQLDAVKTDLMDKNQVKSMKTMTELESALSTKISQDATTDKRTDEIKKIKANVNTGTTSSVSQRVQPNSGQKSTEDRHSSSRVSYGSTCPKSDANKIPTDGSPEDSSEVLHLFFLIFLIMSLLDRKGLSRLSLASTRGLPALAKAYLNSGEICKLFASLHSSFLSLADDGLTLSLVNIPPKTSPFSVLHAKVICLRGNSALAETVGGTIYIKRDSYIYCGDNKEFTIVVPQGKLSSVLHVGNTVTCLGIPYQVPSSLQVLPGGSAAKWQALLCWDSLYNDSLDAMFSQNLFPFGHFAKKIVKVQEIDSSSVTLSYYAETVSSCSSHVREDAGGNHLQTTEIKQVEEKKFVPVKLDRHWEFELSELLVILIKCIQIDGVPLDEAWRLMKATSSGDKQTLPSSFEDFLPYLSQFSNIFVINDEKIYLRAEYAPGRLVIKTSGFVQSITPSEVSLELYLICLNCPVSNVYTERNVSLSVGDPIHCIVTSADDTPSHWKILYAWKDGTISHFEGDMILQHYTRPEANQQFLPDISSILQDTEFCEIAKGGVGDSHAAKVDKDDYKEVLSSCTEHEVSIPSHEITEDVMEEQATPQLYSTELLPNITSVSESIMATVSRIMEKISVLINTVEDHDINGDPIRKSTEIKELKAQLLDLQKLLENKAQSLQSLNTTASKEQLLNNWLRTEQYEADDSSSFGTCCSHLEENTNAKNDIETFNDERKADTETGRSLSDKAIIRSTVLYESTQMSDNKETDSEIGQSVSDKSIIPIAVISEGTHMLDNRQSYIQEAAADLMVSVNHNNDTKDMSEKSDSHSLINENILCNYTGIQKGDCINTSKDVECQAGCPWFYTEEVYSQTCPSTSVTSYAQTISTGHVMMSKFC